jgi:hypothetical protein
VLGFGCRPIAIVSCFLCLGLEPALANFVYDLLFASCWGGSPLRPSLIDALKDALGCNDRVVDRGLIGRRSRLGWYLCQLARCQNGGGYEQYALAPFVHPGILYLSPYIRLDACTIFLIPSSAFASKLLPFRDARRALDNPIGRNDDCFQLNLREKIRSCVFAAGYGRRGSSGTAERPSRGFCLPALCPNTPGVDIRKKGLGR